MHPIKVCSVVLPRELVSIHQVEGSAVDGQGLANGEVGGAVEALVCAGQLVSLDQDTLQ